MYPLILLVFNLALLSALEQLLIKRHINKVIIVDNYKTWQKLSFGKFQDDGVILPKLSPKAKEVRKVRNLRMGKAILNFIGSNIIFRSWMCSFSVCVYVQIFKV